MPTLPATAGTTAAPPTAIHVAPLRAHDRAAWEALARAYHAFYEEQFPPATYDRAWKRLRASDEIRALAAFDGHRIVGIVHYLFHAHVWDAAVCYLQDLFVIEDARGRGVARQLIARVEREARDGGACRVYWLTKNDNAPARRLYDKIATHSGFIRYEDQL